MGQNNLRLLIPEIEKKLAEIDLELVEIEYLKEDKQQMLRIYIDQDAGVDLETCAEASRTIKDLIDENDIYYDHMEVSSPGLDRILKREKDFMRFMGREVNIKMFKDYEGPRKISGILTAYSKDTLKIKKLDRIIDVPCNLISVARLKPDE